MVTSYSETSRCEFERPGLRSQMRDLHRKLIVLLPVEKGSMSRAKAPTDEEPWAKRQHNSENFISSAHRRHLRRAVRQEEVRKEVGSYQGVTIIMLTRISIYLR